MGATADPIVGGTLIAIVMTIAAADEMMIDIPAATTIESVTTAVMIGRIVGEGRSVGEG